MDSLASLSREIEASGADLSGVAASAGAYLRQRNEQRLREVSSAPIVAPKPAPQMSHYHSQIAASTVEKPRGSGKGSKRQRKAEKGGNYRSRVIAKQSRRQEKATKVKKARRR